MDIQKWKRRNLRKMFIDLKIYSCHALIQCQPCHLDNICTFLYQMALDMAEIMWGRVQRSQ